MRSHRQQTYDHASRMNTLHLRLVHSLIFLLFSVVTFGQANFVMGPTPVTTQKGQVFDVTVQVQAGNLPIDLAEIHLNFNPSVLKVTDLKPHDESLTPSPFVPQNYDNVAGTIDYAGYTVMDFPSGTFNLITIEFEAIGKGDGQLSFESMFPRQSLITSMGNDVLSGTSASEITVQNTAPAFATLEDVEVLETGSVTVSVAVGDVDLDALTVQVTTASSEPQLLQTANTGTQNDPYPTTAAGFLTQTNLSNVNGSYSVDLVFAPTFGDGGGANGDGNGTYDVTLTADDGDGGTATETFVLTVQDVAQPIASSAITKIEAESFDNQGPANTNPNGTGDIKGIGVEVNNSGVTNIGFTNEGDFAEYEIDVEEAGTYSFNFQVAKNSGADATMTINGGPATITVSPTGGWQTYVTVSTEVELVAGAQTLRFDWSGPGFLFNIDYFEVQKVGGIVDTTPPVIALNPPETVNLLVGEAFVEPGFTASDNIDGDLTSSVTVTPQNVDTNAPGQIILTYSVFDAAGLEGTATRTINITSPPAEPLLCEDGTEVLYRINAGGPQIMPTGTDEVTWQADASSGFLVAGGQNTFGSTQGVDISGVPSDKVSNGGTSVYATERWDPPSGEEMKYVFPVQANTEVKVSLLLMEGFQTQEGARVFDVSVQGAVPPTFDDLDPVLDAGGAGIAYIREHSQSITTEELVLEFLRVAENPAIRGIQVCGVPIVVDNTPPTITLVGANPLELAVGDSYVEPGATAEDDVDGEINSAIVIDASAVNTSEVGSYEVTYNVADQAGNAAMEVIRTVNVTDQDPPVITLNGDPIVTITQGDSYIDAGATATDNVDVAVNVVVSGTVDPSLAGTYILAYNATDLAGNMATEVTRTVIVEEPPVEFMVCEGPNEVLYRINVGGPMVASTDNAMDWMGDANNGAGKSPFRIGNGGSNLFGISNGLVTDFSGLPLAAANDIFLTERWDPPAAPEMIWEFPVEPGTDVKVSLLLMEGFSGNNAAGDRVFDVSVEGVVPMEFTGIDPVADAGAGVAYIREYTTQAIGNTLDLVFVHTDFDNPAIRGIQVCGTPLAADVTPPVITLNGANPLELAVGDMYDELGASAEDDVDGDISGDIMIDASAVNTAAVGTYQVTYNVTDAAGNAAEEEVRLVNVTDQTAPVITLLGDNPVQLVVGDGYYEAGATALDNVDGDISANLSIDASNVDMSTAGSYEVTYNVTDASNNSATTVTRTVDVLTPTELQECVQVLYRINVGGPQIDAVGGDGPAFLQDLGNFSAPGNSAFLASNSPGNSTYNGNAASAHAGAIDLSNASVPAFASAEIFNTERFDQFALPAQSWAFPVEQGDEIQITLLFAELFGQIDQPGERVFDVEIEGQVFPGFNDIDQFVIAGPKGAFSRTATLVAGDDVLDIALSHVVENPALKGIQVCSLTPLPNTAPVVQITAPVDGADVQRGTFVPLTATAIDNEEGDLSSNIVWSSEDIQFETNPPTATGGSILGAFLTPGAQMLMASAGDSEGMVSTDQITVNVSAPSVTITSPVEGGTVTSPNLQLTWTSTDVLFDLTEHFHIYVNPEDVANIDTDTRISTASAPGQQFWPLSLSDGLQYGSNTIVIRVANQFHEEFDNPEAQAIVNFDIVDEVPPVITLLGDNPFELFLGGTFEDPGATASDDVDGDITNNIDSDASALDAGTLGSYEVTYDVSDAAGNDATQVVRTVDVVVADQVFLSIDPAVSNVEELGSFSATVRLAAGLQSVDAVEFHLAFDPAQLEVTAMTSLADAQLPVVLVPPAFDNGAGTISFNSASFTAYTGGSLDLLQIDFKVIGDQSSSISFVDPDGPTSTTVAFIGNPVLTGSTGANVNVTPLPPLLIGGLDDITVGNDAGLCTAELMLPLPTITNARGTVVFETSLGVDPGAPFTFESGATSVTYTATDELTGKTASETFVVTVDDVELPVITCIEEDLPISIPWGGTGAIVELPIPQFEDNCDGATLQQIVGPASGSEFPLGTTAVAFEVTDASGNKAACSFNVVVEVEEPNGIPAALVEVTPGSNLNASTFGGSDKFQITNNSTGNLLITDVSIDLSSGILPDMVWDPIGSGGDATAQCFNANGGLATSTGLVAPADNCVDPFSQPRNGGFDVISMSFTGFEPGEFFSFSSDIDPNNIQGVPGAGNAGAVSGFELVGATVTVTFNDGSVLTSSLYEDGSLGGAQAVVAGSAPAAPSIAAVGQDMTNALVGDANQVITVMGTAGANFSLLQVDSRLFIASGDDPFDVSPEELPFYSNEAMAKVLYSGMISPDGAANVPVTLLQTAGSGGTDGGKNYFVAVTSASPHMVDQQVSQTSNTVILSLVPCTLEVAVEVTNPEQPGELGSVEFAATSAYADVTILVRDAAGEDVDFAGGVPAGEYTYTATDGVCEVSGTFSIIAPEEPTEPTVMSGSLLSSVDVKGGVRWRDFRRTNDGNWEVAVGNEIGTVNGPYSTTNFQNQWKRSRNPVTFEYDPTAGTLTATTVRKGGTSITTYHVGDLGHVNYMQWFMRGDGLNPNSGKTNQTVRFNDVELTVNGTTYDLGDYKVKETSATNFIEFDLSSGFKITGFLKFNRDARNQEGGKLELLIGESNSSASTRTPVIASTTIKEKVAVKSELMIKVYPNPARDFVNIETDEDITIFTTTGKMMYQGKAGKIDVSSWADGLYLIRAGNETKRLILN